MERDAQTMRDNEHHILWCVPRMFGNDEVHVVLIKVKITMPQPDDKRRSNHFAWFNVKTMFKTVSRVMQHTQIYAVHLIAWASVRSIFKEHHWQCHSVH